MYVQERIYNHFLDLVSNKKFAKNYFQTVDISQFNNVRLNQLKKDLKRSKFEYEKMILLLSIVQFFNIEQKLSSVALKTEIAHDKLKTCINHLDIFEANLAFLLFSDVIKLENCESLGLDLEYIKELMYGYKKQIKNPYVEYYYDEKTGRTSRVTASGKMIILPYTPIAVRNKINDQHSGKYRGYKM